MSKISELSDGGSLISSDYLIAVRSGGNVKVRMDQINVDQVDLGDNEFIRLGNSQDLTMVHTSTQSIINQAGIGDLLLQRAGATKLTINASGIDVTGSVTADGLTVDGTGSVTQSSNAATALMAFTNSNAGASARSAVSFASDAGSSVVGTVSSGWTVDALNANETFVYGSNGVALFAPASQNIRFLAGGSEKVLITSAGNVGIGTSSVSAPLTIGYSGAEAQLQINNSGDNRMVYLGAFSENEGIVRLFNSSDVETVRIAAESTAGVHTYFNGGNVGIGTSSVSAPLHIKSSTGNAIFLQENGSPTTGTGQVGRFVSTTSNVTDAIDSNGYYRIGGSTNPATGAGFSERMRIDSSGHAIIPAGVTLGTAVGVYNAANTLEDYEEGTWTPSVSTSSGTIGTVSGQTGTYTKIGKQVTLWWNFNITDIGTGSGVVIISNASKPFSHDSSINYPIGISRPRSGTSSICELDTSGGIYMYGSTTGVSFYTGTITYNVA